jgi:hypothetical protein
VHLNNSLTQQGLATKRVVLVVLVLVVLVLVVTMPTALAVLVVMASPTVSG